MTLKFLLANLLQCDNTVSNVACRYFTTSIFCGARIGHTVQQKKAICEVFRAMCAQENLRFFRAGRAIENAFIARWPGLSCIVQMIVHLCQCWVNGVTIRSKEPRKPCAIKEGYWEPRVPEGAKGTNGALLLQGALLGANGAVCYEEGTSGAKSPRGRSHSKPSSSQRSRTPYRSSNGSQRKPSRS